MKKIVFLLIVTIGMIYVISAGVVNASSTRVKGHQSDRYDQDQNGISDAGVYVNGHYTSVYAYDDTGAYHWDLGDGRIYGYPSIDLLDQETLTTCEYVINYRADFGNDPYMNDGWIQNHINCSGYDDNGHYNYLIVSDDDPRYTGNPDWALWGNWEYHVLSQSHDGNLVKVMKHLTE